MPLHPPRHAAVAVATDPRPYPSSHLPALPSLALSLHAPTQELRQTIVPSAKAFKLDRQALKLQWLGAAYAMGWQGSALAQTLLTQSATILCRSLPLTSPAWAPPPLQADGSGG